MGTEISLCEGDIDVWGSVKELQQALTDAGFPPELGVDGKFKSRTRKAVEEFQQAHSGEPHNLKVDGIVGNATWAALKGRDPEPPGVNNECHGDTRPHGERDDDDGGGTGTGTHQGGIGASQPDHVDFTSTPTFDGSYVYVDTDTTNSTNVQLQAAVWNDAGTTHHSQWVKVNSNGPQTIPLGVSVVPGTWYVAVTAIAGGGNQFTSDTATITF